MSHDQYRPDPLKAYLSSMSARQRIRSACSWIVAGGITTVALILVVLALTGCQINEYYASGSARITLDASGNQERGGQTTDAINPSVDTGDIQGLPGL